MAFPYSIKFICGLLAVIGCRSDFKFKRAWQNRVIRFYCRFYTVTSVVALLTHILGTTTRAVRELPEFLQRLLEDLAFTLFLVDCLLFKYNFKAFSNLMTFMECHFSSADKAIIGRSHAKARFLFRTLSAACILTFVGALVEPFFPVSAEETQRLGYIYKRSRPERRLPTNFWIPFFDDSLSPTYEILFVVEIYLICVEIVQNIVSASVIPMLVTYMMGQYKIIRKFAAKVGCTHRNSNGEVIYYTNIETNEFVIQTRRVRSEMCQDEYDQVFVGQLVRFHQKLIKFQKMFEQFYTPIMFIKVSLSNALVALVLYQLCTTDLTSIPSAHLYKLLIEFVSVMFVVYYLCHCSESLDDAQEELTISLASSHWFNCSPATRRMLVMMLRRSQRPNHLKFYQGTLILSRAYFWSVGKLSYSFVNSMKLFKH